MDEAASRVRMDAESASPELKSLEEKLAALRKEKAEVIAKQDYEKAPSSGTSSRTMSSRWKLSGIIGARISP